MGKIRILLTTFLRNIFFMIFTSFNQGIQIWIGRIEVNVRTKIGKRWNIWYAQIHIGIVGYLHFCIIWTVARTYIRKQYWRRRVIRRLPFCAFRPRNWSYSEHSKSRRTIFAGVLKLYLSILEYFKKYLNKYVHLWNKSYYDLDNHRTTYIIKRVYIRWMKTRRNDSIYLLKRVGKNIAKYKLNFAVFYSM